MIKLSPILSLTQSDCSFIICCLISSQLINTPLSPPRPSIIYQLETQRDRERDGEKGKAQPFHLERKLFMTSMENRKTKRPEEYRKNQIREESREDKWPTISHTYDDNHWAIERKGGLTHGSQSNSNPPQFLGQTMATVMKI